VHFSQPSIEAKVACPARRLSRSRPAVTLVQQDACDTPDPNPDVRLTHY
jgi:hypothetical protein